MRSDGRLISLRVDVISFIRIPIMAAFRNRALAPLFDAKSHFHDPSTLVLFLNDILVTADQLVELMLTNDMEYDMACSMDFESLQLYDIWVARDLHGRHLSRWFPFFR
jgi:hypothetical protein